MRRSFDAGDINPILNNPEVLPAITLPGIDHLDVTEQVSDPRNVLLMAEGGGILFCQHEPGIYELHTNFLPGYRGRYVLRTSIAAYRWMFTCTDAMVLLTRVPAFNKGADLFARIAGFTCEFERTACWPTLEGACDMRFFALRYDDWVRKTPDLADSGRAFHDRFEQERARLGHTEPRNHPDDEAHELHAGACAEMLYGGQPEKAVALYNRWARFSGYGTIALIGRNPLVIDIGDGLLFVRDGTFTVLKVGA